MEKQPLNLIGIFGFSISLAVAITVTFIFHSADFWLFRLIVLLLALIGALLSLFGVLKTAKKGAGAYIWSLLGVVLGVAFFLVAGLLWLYSGWH